MVNRLMDVGEKAGSPPAADYPVAYDLAKQLNAVASPQGIADFGAYWAGQGAPLARALPARELIQALVQEMA